MTKEKLALRKKIKKKKPDFSRQNSVKKRLGKKWRKPKGIQSKLRLNLRGYNLNVSQGYRSPKEVRGLSPEGKIIRYVYNLGDLKSIKEEEIIVIAGTVGMKKKAELVKKAGEKGIALLNVKDIGSYLKQVEDIMKKRSEKKAKIEEKRKSKDKEIEKEKPKEKELTEDEKIEKEKKEKDKLLAKKDIK
ncbi:50S ribosomal protein L32e [Candidatus Woesearchaeota archaeon]|nr:50S ribosomal protein L32e [Candidatus Woesearchaeota archaeon]